MAHLAPALVRLRAEVDRRWPTRSKASDGWLGDAAHAARVSDHNPDGKGEVHAIDVTAAGIDVAVLLRAAIGNPAVWYVIHDGHIWSRTYGWAKRVYTGPNPHRHHVHISIRYTAAAENWDGSWLLRAVKAAAVLRAGATGTRVTALQRALKITADGTFGPKTAAAVNRLKHQRGWPEDGVAGSRVLEALRLS
jgi:hypothetical protein